MAMSKNEPCLDILLRGQLHIHDPSPQTLGRISWPVVAGMGLRLLRTLQEIHQRGGSKGGVRKKKGGGVFFGRWGGLLCFDFFLGFFGVWLLLSSYCFFSSLL